MSLRRTFRRVFRRGKVSHIHYYVFAALSKAQPDQGYGFCRCGKKKFVRNIPAARAAQETRMEKVAEWITEEQVKKATGAQR